MKNMNSVSCRRDITENTIQSIIQSINQSRGSYICIDVLYVLKITFSLHHVIAYNISTNPHFMTLGSLISIYISVPSKKPKLPDIPEIPDDIIDDILDIYDDIIEFGQAVDIDQLHLTTGYYSFGVYTLNPPAYRETEPVLLRYSGG